MEAVAGQLVKRDIIPKLTGRGDLGQQVLDQVMDLPLRASEVRPPMQEGGEFGAGVLVGKRSWEMSASGSAKVDR